MTGLSHRTESLLPAPCYLLPRSDAAPSWKTPHQSQSSAKLFGMGRSRLRGPVQNLPVSFVSSLAVGYLLEARNNCVHPLPFLPEITARLFELVTRFASSFLNGTDKKFDIHIHCNNIYWSNCLNPNKLLLCEVCSDGDSAPLASISSNWMPVLTVAGRLTAPRLPALAAHCLLTQTGFNPRIRRSREGNAPRLSFCLNIQSLVSYSPWARKG